MRWAVQHVEVFLAVELLNVSRRICIVDNRFLQVKDVVFIFKNIFLLL